jgi:hypothetical protein
MKKLLVVCLVVMTWSALVLASGLTSIQSTESPSKNSAAQLKEEITSLLERIEAAKALHQQPDEFLYTRLEQLIAQSEGRSSLDCLPHNDGQITLQAPGVCDSALAITALPFTETGSFDLVDDCAGRPYNDVFYSFTAPYDASFAFDLCGSYNDSYMRIWLDGTCCVGSYASDDNACGNNSLDPKYILAMTTGQTVIIECGLYNPSSRRRAYAVHVNEVVPPPLNDVCGGAVPLNVPSETFGETTYANIDVAPACGTAGTPSANGVWYTVVGDGHLYTATTCDDRTTYDTKISIFVGSCGQFACIDGNDDDNTCADYRSTVTWCAENGVTYYILVHGYQTANGSFLLGLTSGATCGNNCESMPLCGEPAEVEQNNSCPPPESQTVLTCDGTVYGRICMLVAADHDFWKVIVPPHTILHVAQYDGDNCATNPTTCVQSKVYYENCTLAAANASTTGWTATNSTDDPFVFYVDVFGLSSCMGSYKLTATCCQTVDYCANPIVIPGVTHFESTVNTCCATNPIASVFATGCSGTTYGSGTDVIYLMNLAQATTMNITVTGGDAQVMVFTDCANAAGTCVASADILSGLTETLSALTLPAGVYYVSMSMYAPTGSSACGDMTIVIDGDHPLAVNLSSFTAVPGDASVVLNWRTASENGNDRFEIMRDNRIVGTVSSRGNSSSAQNYSWTDTGLRNGNEYTYDLYSVDMEGARAHLSSVNATPARATAQVTEYCLYQNYPNPFNPVTQISFDLLEAGTVSLKVYNLMGQMVSDLVSGSLGTGHHSITFDARDLPSGLYLYRLSVNGFSAEKKMLLLK